MQNLIIFWMKKNCAKFFKSFIQQCFKARLPKSFFISFKMPLFCWKLSRVWQRRMSFVGLDNARGVWDNHRPFVKSPWRWFVKSKLTFFLPLVADRFVAKVFQTLCSYALKSMLDTCDGMVNKTIKVFKWLNLVNKVCLEQIYYS